MLESQKEKSVTVKESSSDSLDISTCVLGCKYKKQLVLFHL